MDIDHLRREYLQGGLRREHLLENPIEQFRLWLKQACEAELTDPTALTLATVSAEGRPSQRTVLLKYFDDTGFVFFTNLESRKARQMAENPNVSMLFGWLPLERQVIINGTAEKISKTETLKYFLSRPKDSQLAAWASQQSRPISSRAILEAKFAELKRKFSEGEVPLPSFWGGYRVKPREIEFWQGGAKRLHDRFLYTRQEGQSWHIERLAP